MSANLDAAVSNFSKTWVSAKSLTRTVNAATTEGSVELEADQALWVPEHHWWTVVIPNPFINGFSSTGAAGATNQYQEFHITPGTAIHIEDITVMWQFKETGGTNSVTLVPAPFWIDHVEIYVNGTTQLIQQLWPEQMLFHMGAFMTQEQQIRFAQLANFQVPSYAQETAIPASGTVNYFWPLFGNFIACNEGLFLPAMKDDIVIRIYFSKNGIVKSGSGTIALNAQQLILHGHKYTSTEVDALTKRYANTRIEFNYLDTLHIQQVRTETAGVQDVFQLQSTVGLTPYFIWCLRSNYSGTNDQMLQFQSLGPGVNSSYWEFDDPAQVNMLSNVDLDPSYLQIIETNKHFPGYLPQYLNIYPGIFGDPFGAEQKSIHKGFIALTGKEYFKIFPASGGVAETGEVYTIIPYNPIAATAVAATGGAFAIQWNGMRTTPLTYSASVATIQAAVNVIMANTQGKNNQPIVCTVGGSGMNNTAGITLTFTNLPYIPSAKGYVPTIDYTTLTNGTVVLMGQVTLTTTGVLGTSFPTGIFNIDFYFRIFSHAHISNGKWEVKKI